MSSDIQYYIFTLAFCMPTVFAFYWLTFFGLRLAGVISSSRWYWHTCGLVLAIAVSPFFFWWQGLSIAGAQDLDMGMPEGFMPFFRFGFFSASIGLSIAGVAQIIVQEWSADEASGESELTLVDSSEQRSPVLGSEHLKREMADLRASRRKTEKKE